MEFRRLHPSVLESLGDMLSDLSTRQFIKGDYLGSFGSAANAYDFYKRSQSKKADKLQLSFLKYFVLSYYTSQKNTGR